jgi:hypothetical protein
MPYRYIKNIWAALNQLARATVWTVCDTGAPTTSIGIGMLGPGSTYIDTSTGLTYTNVGTITAPIWAADNAPIQSGTAGGAVGGGLGVVGNAKMTYVFGVDGGAVSTITPTNSPTVPVGAIILGGVIDITTAVVGAGASVALGFGSGAQVAALLAATAVAGAPWSTTGLKAVIPIFTAATAYKLTAAARMTMTISAAVLTVGVFDVNLVYVQGNV